MVAITWDESGKRFYETGLEQGALYVVGSNGQYGNGAGWSGLIKVSESPDGADVTPIYANNKTYLNMVAKENFKGSISAYTYPDEWGACDGSAAPNGSTGSPIKGIRVRQQTRSTFGLVYKTLIGNDTQGTDAGYVLHLVYGATASPSSKDNNTVNDSPEALELSWDFSTVPVNIPGMKPAAHIELDSRDIPKEKLAKLEKVLYGSESAEPKLPLPTEVFAIIGGTI